MTTTNPNTRGSQDETVDTQRIEKFQERLVENMNGAAIMLMISIGHRTGLFDTLALCGPVTSSQLAERASLSERYVREWLGAMVTGRIVDFDPADQHYSLPREHAACLTRAATPENMAGMAQWIPLLASVESQVVDCFENGGGVPYSEFPRFHDTMAEESQQTVAHHLTRSILPLIPGLPERLEQGIDVLDVGCGRGGAILSAAKEFPNSRFVGLDFSDEAVRHAKAEAERIGLKNIQFEARDAAISGVPARFDLVTAFDAIHDQAKPAAVLQNIAEALRPGGHFLMQDIRAHSKLEQNQDHVLGPFLYTISCMHCMTVSLAANGEGLGTCWGEEKAVEMLGAAGFTGVSVHQLDHDIMNNYYLAKTEG